VSNLSGINRWPFAKSGLFASICAVSLIALPQIAFAKPNIYALVVGINAYAHVNQLQGADNDAQLIANTLHSLNAVDVRLLLDGQVTRDAIYRNFRALDAKASPGDWIVFTYAGHGSQEDERPPFRKPSGKDDVFILTNFQTDPPENGERIHDYEIKALLDEVPDTVKVLFVADSCHSGTMTREIDPRAQHLVFRDISYGQIVNDSLPPPASDATDLLTKQRPNVVFAAAALDSETTPELKIEGAQHGALSWYVAHAFAGNADANHDGTTTLEEFRQYIVTGAREASESRQTPAVHFFPGREAEPLPFAGKGNSTVALPPANPILVWVEGGAPGLLSGLPDIVAAPSRGSAELMWDARKGDVVDLQHGDLLAQDITNIGQFSGVSDKWRSLLALKEMSAQSNLDIRLGLQGSGKSNEAGALFRQGQVVTISIGAPTDPKLRYLTVIDLACDGEVQPQYPNNPDEAGPRLAGGLSFDSAVKPPFGVDHLVALATVDSPDQLRAQLMSLTNQEAAGAAARLIAQAVQGKQYALGVLGLHSAP